MKKVFFSWKIIIHRWPIWKINLSLESGQNQVFVGFMNKNKHGQNLPPVINDCILTDFSQTLSWWFIGNEYFKLINFFFELEHTLNKIFIFIIVRYNK